MFFELDDIKRRHSNYYDIYNVNGWVRTPDSTLSWNLQRGVITGITASLINEFIGNFTEGWRLLLRHYEPPNSFKQLGNIY
jgi:solute carrier family 25 oxoglutarate transporter 11